MCSRPSTGLTQKVCRREPMLKLRPLLFRNDWYPRPTSSFRSCSNAPALGYVWTEQAASDKATHVVVITKRA